MSPLGLSGTLEGIAGYTPVGRLLSDATGGTAVVVLQKISSAVLSATRTAIEEVASMIGSATAPNLDSTWFSSTYWRVAALAAMLTIPFLCAAAVQAVARGDLSLLGRVAFGYLPLSILGVSLAAPLTMLLLAATDQMSAAVSAGAGAGGARFLNLAADAAGALSSTTGGSPFFAAVVGLLAVLAALALAVELLVRSAAVYVVVLMLPLAFAAFVWPARRVWAVRVVELLTSLILSKFVIIAVLSLAAAAFTGGSPGINELLVAMSLIMLATFAPWALMRVLPFTELAAGAAGILRNELPRAGGGANATAAAHSSAKATDAALSLPARLRDQARSADAATGAAADPDLASYVTPMFPEPPAGRTAARSEQDAGAAAGMAPDPSVSSAPSARTNTTAAAGESSHYVLPRAWRGRSMVQLDQHLISPAAAAQHPPEGRDE